ncbi:MAG: HD domain-containing protein [Cyanobacteria bacterium SIG30]|nr:HD domain-containing protein [Cyanobacteria bacterium SIG30]
MLNLIDESHFVNNLDSILNTNAVKSLHTILIVDDEEHNLHLLKRTLRGKYNILTASNGEEGMRVFEEHQDKISLIISDHKMPVMEGTKFLELVNNVAPDVIKILLTGFTDIEILTDAVNKCNLFQYILKPFEPSELEKIVENGIEKFDLTSSKSSILKDLKELFYKTIKSIASALDAKDPYTHGHSVRVTLYALILSNALGLNDKELEEIETAGLLHDIGKIAIPQSILCKPGKLTDDEYKVMKLHPENSERLIMSIKKLNGISSWVKTHHERWDGKGYPNGLRGEAIPLSARIIAIADTYDAMTSTRSYRQALSHEVAIEEIQKCAGSQFDPNLASKFIELGEIIKEAKANSDEYYKKYSYLQKEFAKKSNED